MHNEVLDFPGASCMIGRIWISEPEVEAQFDCTICTPTDVAGLLPE
jgi:hypothetical protein